MKAPRSRAPSGKAPTAPKRARGTRSTGRSWVGSVAPARATRSRSRGGAGAGVSSAGGAQAERNRVTPARSLVLCGMPRSTRGGGAGFSTDDRDAAPLNAALLLAAGGEGRLAGDLLGPDAEVVALAHLLEGEPDGGAGGVA